MGKKSRKEKEESTPEIIQDGWDLQRRGSGVERRVYIWRGVLFRDRLSNVFSPDLFFTEFYELTSQDRFPD